MAGAVGTSIVGPSPARDMYAQRIGSALTPRRIASIIADADIGYVAPWHDLLNEIRQKDPPLHSVLQTRELALIAKGWQIAPWKLDGADRAEAQDEEIAAFCREAVRASDGFDRALAHLLDGTYKAFSVVETEWTKRDGSVVPLCFHPRQGRRFLVTSDQRIELYDDGLLNPPQDPIGDLPVRFMVYAPRVNGDSLAREGLGRCLVWFSAFATWGWRDWMLFAELFGKPRTRAEYEQDAYQGETDADIKLALDQLMGRGYTIVPKGVKLLTEWPGGGKNGDTPSPGIIDKCAEWQSLAVLGQRATVAQVQAGLGGNGDVRDLVRKDILKADDVALGACVRKWLLTPLVRMEFGPKANVPLFGFDVEDAKDVKSFAEGIDKLADRLPIPSRYVYETTGIPAPVGDEPTLEKKAPPLAPVASQAPQDAATGPEGPPIDATGSTGPSGPKD